MQDAGIYHHQKLKTYEKELIQFGVFKSIVNAPQGNQFIRNRADKPYIPGSSLKGVLKTAVMYHLVQKKLDEHGHNLAKSFINDILEKIEDFEKMTRTMKPKQRDIEKGKFSLRLQQFIFQNGKTGIKPEFDFFRCVKVKDSEILVSPVNNNAAILSLKSPKKDSLQVKDPPQNNEDCIGVLVKVGEGVEVNYQGRKYDFKNKVYKTQLDLLKANIGKEIQILEWGGNKISKFEILDTVSQKQQDVLDLHTDNVCYHVDYKRNDNNDIQEIPVQTFEGATEMQIVLDQFLLNDFVKNKKYKIPFSNITELLNLVTKFSRDVWQFEKHFFDSCISQSADVSQICAFYNKYTEIPKLRIGWGTGLSGITVDLLLKRDDFAYLRNRLFIKRGGFPAPKSRRIICKGEQALWPLGWVEVEVVESDHL
jgi:CRISPR/Cas system CSM-associated protein Csm5 (group 7 of RAMP superfamily)